MVLVTGVLVTVSVLISSFCGDEIVNRMVFPLTEGLIPAETGRLLKAKLPHVYLMYVYDAAHSIQVDQPERYDRIVGEFLKRGEAFIINFGNDAD